MDLEKIEWVQLDTHKCNIVVIHVPDTASMAEVDRALTVGQKLHDAGVTAAIVVPESYRVEFAEQEPTGAHQ